jgi:hypothetical protein
LFELTPDGIKRIEDVDLAPPAKIARERTLYFRGRFHFDQGTEAGLRAAITEYSGLVAETDTSSNR